MKKYNFGIWLLSFLFLFYSCAQIGTITGGEKDITPPKILKQIPENNSTNFTEKTISITFDEYVELVNPTETFKLSPLLKNEPSISIKGKSVLIDFKECELEANTTYILTCEKGIKDFTEGNMLPLTQFIFSTGNYLDSMTIAGNVKNALTLSGEKDVAVFLHTENEDSTLKNTLPLYITYTDEKGNFRFSNLPNRSFYLSALKDKNSNNLFDQSDESIAFQDKIVEPINIQFDTNNNPIIDYQENKLYLFTEDDTTLKFLKRELAYDFVHKFIFKNKVNDFTLKQISSIDTNIHFVYKKNPTCDSILVFFSDTINTLIDFELYANQTLIDTISLNPNQKNKIRRKNNFEKQVLSYTISQNGDLLHRLQLTFTYPISNYKENAGFCVLLPKDSLIDTIPITFHFIDDIQQTIELDYNLEQENQTYTFICADSVFYNHFGWCNDSINIQSKTNSLKDFGELQVAFQFYEENHFIAELLDDKNKVVQTDYMTFNKKIKYSYLVPGKYQLRIIVDANNNDHWDSGHYLLRQQPEKIIYFDKTIDILANWKIEETFDVIIE